MPRLETSINKQVTEARRKAMRRRKSPLDMTRAELIEEVQELRLEQSWQRNPERMGR